MSPLFSYDHLFQVEQSQFYTKPICESHKGYILNPKPYGRENGMPIQLCI